MYIIAASYRIGLFELLLVIGVPALICFVLYQISATRQNRD